MLKVKFCNICKVLLTDENTYIPVTRFCKKHWNERRKQYRAQMDKYAKSERGKQAINKASRKASIKYPEKWNARSRLRYAVKTGKIVKPEYCDQYLTGKCSTSRIQGHHYLGYEGEHWKDVMWLCSRHHADEHNRLRYHQVYGNL